MLLRRVMQHVRDQNWTAVAAKGSGRQRGQCHFPKRDRENDTDPVSILQNYFRAVDWETDPTLWESEQVIVDYDWDLLRASRAEMQTWIAFQHDLAVFGQEEMDAVEEILEQLEEHDR